MIYTLKKIVLTSFFWAFVPYITLAAPGDDYVPLTSGGIPQVSNIQTLTITDMLNIFFGISVGIAAVLAVIMISIGGFKYMTSESALKSSGAKEQITGAVVGLLIVLGAFLILYVINPDIVSLDLFS